jgi:Putative Actinobacterial Holin-X, holin superfamily III
MAMVDGDTASASAPSEPTLADAVIHVFEAGQRMVLDRIDLARFDLNHLAGRTLRSAVLACAGSVLLAGAWFTAMGGAVVWLQSYLSLAGSLAAAALLSAGVGASAVAVGIRHARGEWEFGSAGAPIRTARGPHDDTEVRAQ